MDTFPDLGALSDQELDDLIQQLTAEEHEVSHQRRLLHGKIDILKAELVNRLRTKREEGEPPIITGADVQQLIEILSGRGESPTRPDRRAAMDTFPDLGALSDHDLSDLVQQLRAEEREVSYERRLLQGKIDILHAELVNRLRTEHEEGKPIITGADVRQLTEILGGRGEPETATGE